MSNAASLTAVPLGQLVRVPLRNVWSSEATSFTPWLGLPENLAQLGEALGISLELEAQEQYVGPFRADLLCKDTATEHWVLIENQLERTDHNHLGQILTYAAGLKAITIIWIAERFTNEHRATLDWLNDITDDDFQFFGVEVEAWQIGDSPVAPRFSVVSKPNDWTKSVRQGASTVVLPPVKQLQLEFWTSFRDFMEEHSNIRCQKPLPQHWMNHAIGRSGFHLASVASTYDSETDEGGGELRIELIVHPDAKRLFPLLEGDRSEVERIVGQPLTWRNDADTKSAKVFVRTSARIEDRERWPEYFRWLQSHLELFTKAFATRVKALKSADDADRSS